MGEHEDPITKQSRGERGQAPVADAAGRCLRIVSLAA